jgi:hypothetical protein
MMKKYSTLCGIFVGLLLMIVDAQAAPFTISDNYTGAAIVGGSWSDKDVIASPKEQFQIDSMSVNFSGSKMDLSLNGSFFSYYVNKNVYRMRLGDVFISTNGWNPYGTGSHDGDNVTNGEVWEYAVVLGDTASGGETGSGNFSLYAVPQYTKGLSGALAAGINLSSKEPLTNAIWRENQEWAFTPKSGTAALATGSWSITNNTLSILGIDWTKMNISGNSLGLHWTMSCGNDVIEGAAPVPTPEPSTILLLTCGLLGVSVYARKTR